MQPYQRQILSKYSTNHLLTMYKLNDKRIAIVKQLYTRLGVETKEQYKEVIASELWLRGVRVR